MYTPDELTGAIVLDVRTRYKLSRVEFSDLVGFSGKSTARLNNIEKRDSWKAGDREMIAAAINTLVKTAGAVGAVKSRGESSASAMHVTHPASGDGGSVVLLDPDYEDELNEQLVAVLPIEDFVPPAWELAPPVLPAQLDPEVHAFSNSEFQTFKRCRRKWWLAWYRNMVLRTEDYTGVRSTGTRVHTALEAWYVPEGRQRVDPRDALERVIVEDWTKIINLAQSRGANDEQLAELATDFAGSTNLERAMVEGYVQWLEETGADSELRIVGSEVPMIVDVELPMGDDEPRQIQLIGLLDSRAHRVTDGKRLFVDHKTVGDLQGPVITLPQNEQMLHYHLLEFLSGGDGDALCDGALYNMLRRVKRSARAKPPFYERVEVRHNQFELDSYKQRAFAVSREILRTIDALDRGEHHLDVVYPSPTSSCRWDCDFFAVCNMFDDGSSGVNDMIGALYTQGNPRERYDKKGRDA